MFAEERLALAARFAELLGTEGVLRGLIGPREVPRLWERHLLNCAVLEELLPVESSVCDVGSGAGLPGIVLAIARPDLEVTLVEPLLRRTTFLEEVVGELGLSRVRVVRGRAEGLHGVERFDAVTSRAVARLPRLIEWCLPLAAPTGVVLALKGRSVADEIAESRAALVGLGAGVPEVLELGAGRISPQPLVVRVPWADPASVSWPSARPPQAPARSRKSTPRKRGRQRE